jgi:calcium-dependent protein kinase
VGAVIEFSELESLLEMYPDGEQHGMINYNDFVAAMLDTACVTKERKAVRRSFEVLDADGDGKITAIDIVKASGGRMSVEKAREMVSETIGNSFAADEDVELDYATFEKMMQA